MSWVSNQRHWLRRCPVVGLEATSSVSSSNYCRVSLPSAYKYVPKPFQRLPLEDSTGHAESLRAVSRGRAAYRRRTRLGPTHGSL